MKRVIWFVICCVLCIKVLSVDSYAGTDKVYSDAQKEFLKEVYENIAEKNNDFEVIYHSTDQIWEIDDIYYVLSSIDDPINDDDYDYLRGNISRIECEVKAYGFMATKYHFKISWFEDKDQTEEVNRLVKEILKENKVKDMNDYEKVKFVHDYIIENIKYDKSKQHFSAYDGLVNNSTVCQGFALLTYKMLASAGVSCRYVVGKYDENGTGDGENHAWNIVKLGNMWYYLDNTWDACAYDQIPNEKNKYLYFLKGSNSFDTEHIIDIVENGENFSELYNISKVDYNRKLGSGSLTEHNSDDDAVTPYQFFKMSDDGSLSTGNRVLACVADIFGFVYMHLAALLVIVLIIVLYVVYRKAK